MAAWLNRQRKADLAALAEAAGISHLDGLLREDLVAKIDDYLAANSSRLAGNAIFKEYYSRNSPAKRTSTSTGGTGGDTDTESKPKKKKVPKLKEETHGVDSITPAKLLAKAISPVKNITPAIKRTVAAVQAQTPAVKDAIHNINVLPTSPSEIAEAIEHQTRRVSTGVTQILRKADSEPILHHIREALSSVVGVESIILMIEGYALQKSLIPWRTAFSLPNLPFIGPTTVEFPDFFILLTDIYWSRTILWALISFWLPLATSWLFNLTLRPATHNHNTRHSKTSHTPTWRFDPLIFNLAKALISWLVFFHGVRIFGIFSDSTVNAVLNSMPAGYIGVQIGSAIGMLLSLYDAVQRH